MYQVISLAISRDGVCSCVGLTKTDWNCKPEWPCLVKRKHLEDYLSNHLKCIGSKKPDRNFEFHPKYHWPSEFAYEFIPSASFAFPSLKDNYALQGKERKKIWCYEKSYEKARQLKPADARLAAAPRSGRSLLYHRVRPCISRWSIKF
ncbi:uncharacterized protein SPPG_09318 [Spizellomyces punctatus DAOM BR117]|uniref:Uncharacterized protein n=1 Tax=Spizellomyces punctatus (strain DAOM BR117) TaxID=645134 RepID=A0A0L0HD37_SPIPD|nr:uncharacterized protein SPPG_09318 [Spizellomyces punctatus DAOM BR117]KNC98874.1 hypothetical protein SPPG_09318 [Spizellomyces punctatus DAOM BR117]|eukprot:XP_016606914.1 hypothetical protein SPPG_09318 [Spizellomyces punctatus DAOM BR117]